MNNWEVIKNKKIIDLFIGDGSLRNSTIFEDLRMPYMRGEDICIFGKKIGISIKYNEKKYQDGNIWKK